MSLPIMFAVVLSQVGYTPSSIEWLAASSDVVARASVADVSLKDQEPPSPGLYWPWKWATVRLRVHERLKGEPADTIVFVVGIPNGSTTLEEWKKSETRMIWFLNVHDPKADGTPIPEGATEQERKWRPRRARGLGGAVLEPGERVFSLELKILDTDEAIAKAIRAEAARKSNTRDARNHNIHLPRSIAERTGKSGDVNSLSVPVDERLEILAREWTVSKDAWIRQAGAEALVHFKSDKHRTLLQTLLADPDAAVRKAVQQTLDQWSGSNPQPPRDR